MIAPDAWWRDPTGRFENRPFYREASIEAAAFKFSHEILGQPTWPLSDDNIEFLADMKSSFDRSRDIASFEIDADAVTIFPPEGQPRIVLSRRLSPQPMRLRRRMTLAHELGHVVLHEPLYRGRAKQLDMLQEYRSIPAYCTDAMATASVDWCEWQASYFGGALLAPESGIQACLSVGSVIQEPMKEGSPDALRATALIASHFDISRQAGRVRLAQIHLIVPANDAHLRFSGLA